MKNQPRNSKMSLQSKMDSKIFEVSVDEEAKKICHYGLIFTDCSMPFMDGYECCEKMNKILDEANILDKDERPLIVAVTGHVESEYKRKAILSGMDSIYSKPIKTNAVAMILLESKFNIKLPQSLEREL